MWVLVLTVDAELKMQVRPGRAAGGADQRDQLPPFDQVAGLDHLPFLEQHLDQLAVDAAIVLASLLLAGYLFLSFYRVMDGGLKETRRHLRAMTSGDLTTSPSPWGNDEAAQLMLELRNMQESLRTMVLRVRRSSDEIVHSSSEIATGASFPPNVFGSVKRAGA